MTVIVPSAIGVLGFALLIAVGRRIETPLLSPTLLGQPIIWRSSVCVLLFAAPLFAGLIQVPLLLELACGIGPSLSGLLLISLTLPQACVSTWAGIHMSATCLPKNPLVVGFAIATVGSILLATTLSLGPSAIAISSIVFGLGLGTTMPAAQTLAQWVGGKSRLGVTTATLTFSRSVGGVIGTAATSAVLLAAIEHFAPGSAADIQDAISASGKAGGQAVQVGAVIYAFRWVFSVIAAFTFVATLLALSVPPVNLADPEPSDFDSKSV